MSCQQKLALLPSTYLGEQVVHHVCANVVVDLVEDAIVTINGAQPSPQIAPLLPIRQVCEPLCCSRHPATTCPMAKVTSRLMLSTATQMGPCNLNTCSPQALLSSTAGRHLGLWAQLSPA